MVKSMVILPDEYISMLSTYMVAHNYLYSSPGGFDTLVWPPEALDIYAVHRFTCK